MKLKDEIVNEVTSPAKVFCYCISYYATNYFRVIFSVVFLFLGYLLLTLHRKLNASYNL